MDPEDFPPYWAGFQVLGPVPFSTAQRSNMLSKLLAKFFRYFIKEIPDSFLCLAVL